MCHNGLHLTESPSAFCHALSGMEFYVAEGDGEHVSTTLGESCWRRARLLRPATAEELAAHFIFISGVNTPEPEALSAEHSKNCGLDLSKGFLFMGEPA